MVTAKPGAWLWVRRAIGALLFAAALLKTYQLATMPLSETDLLSSRWFLIAAVQLELFFAFALVSGLHARVVQRAACALFAGLLLLAVWKVLRGEKSCGCFGPVEVNPLFTVALDLSALASLLLFAPPRSCLDARGHCPRQAMTLVVVWGMAAILSVAASLHGAPLLSGDDDFVGRPGGIAVLDPERWIGKPCPLLDHIETDAPLRQGEWIVVLYHDDCPKCREVIPLWQSEVRQGGTALILVAVPPVSATRSDLFAGVGASSRSGRLTQDRKWLTQTPTRFCLSNGVTVKCAQADGARLSTSADHE